MEYINVVKLSCYIQNRQHIDAIIRYIVYDHHDI